MGATAGKGGFLLETIIFSLGDASKHSFATVTGRSFEFQIKKNTFDLDLTHNEVNPFLSRYDLKPLLLRGCCMLAACCFLFRPKTPTLIQPPKLNLQVIQPCQVV